MKLKTKIKKVAKKKQPQQKQPSNGKKELL